MSCGPSGPSERGCAWCGTIILAPTETQRILRMAFFLRWVTGKVAEASYKAGADKIPGGRGRPL